MHITRIVFLWHMHQPFYKDLITGEYRLPWVRMHALKDYYGMVKLLDEFPRVHQTFNLVPSLVAQIQDYVAGTAKDPFFDLAAKPASDLTPDERRFVLTYFFQANHAHMIGRYPRYRELWEQFRVAGCNPERALPFWQMRDFADLQVLSQLAWFDEYFLHQPDVAALVRKGRGFSTDDQRFVMAKQREIMAAVLPAYKVAAEKGSIEISASPFYHPILPLLCDTGMGAVSTPGLKLPRRFQHPEDAREQIQRGLDLHEKTFGMRPLGLWPSEGSVSEEVLAIAHQLGVRWMATDEGVLGRSIGHFFHRDGGGRLQGNGASELYRLYRYQQGSTEMYLTFRDHTLSDLIGFVYSGMNPRDAAQDFIRRIKEGAAPVFASGTDATVSIILDGENAWEYYPGSGREFLRRLYDAIERDDTLEACTFSEAIFGQSVSRAGGAAVQHRPSSAVGGLSIQSERRSFARLQSLAPGSWINANFNVWIGAPEDNRAWDYLSAARDFYAEHATRATEAQRLLAFEELLIAEGSDWNWWYGPEHHSANDQDFDELYRKHLSNVYHALGATPPPYLAQPIAAIAVRPEFVPQTAYIHPRLAARFPYYFDWIGAAMYTADRRAGAMHGKQFLLDAIYAGIDETSLYGRLDFVEPLPEGEYMLLIQCEREPPPEAGTAHKTLRLECMIQDRTVSSWRLSDPESSLEVSESERSDPRQIEVHLAQRFTFKMPLALLDAVRGSKVRLRFILWHDRLPLDALPVEGWMELPVVSEEDMEGGAYNYGVSS